MNKKYRFSCLIVIFFSVFLCQTIVYSALVSELKIEGLAYARVDEEIRISGVELVETTNGGVEKYVSEYTKNTIKTGVELPNLNSTITYKFKVANMCDVQQKIESINIIDNNENIIYELDYVVGDSIASGMVKEILMTIKYNSDISSLPTNKIDEMTLTFNFDVYHVHSDSNDDFYCDGCELWIVPEGATYYRGAEVNYYGVITTNANTEIINSLEPVLTSATVGDVLSYGDYNYIYDTKTSGWNINTIDNYKSTYGKPIFDVNYSKITSLYSTFHSSSNLSVLDVSFWDVSNVSDFSYLFMYAGSKVNSIVITGLNTWDVSNATTMENMFYHLGFNAYENGTYVGTGASTVKIGNLSSWNVLKLESMFAMFFNAGCEATTFELTGLESWDTRNVKDMMSAFGYCGQSADHLIDLRGWNVSSVTNYNNFNPGVETKVLAPNFVGDPVYYSLVDGSTLNELIPANTTKIIFTNIDSPSGVTLTDISVSNDNGIVMWSSGTTIYISTRDNYGVILANEDSSSMFSFLAELSFIEFNYFDTRNVTSMSSMFMQTGTNAESFIITGMEDWDTSKVTYMSNMFSGAGQWATTWSIGDLSEWKMTALEEANSMFMNAGYSATTFSLGAINKWMFSDAFWDAQAMFAYTGYSADYILDLSGWVIPNEYASGQNFNYDVDTKIIAPEIFADWNVGFWDDEW